MATALTQTTTVSFTSATGTVLQVASATGISAPTNNVQQKLYVINPGKAQGELMGVAAVNGKFITVSRLDEYKGSILSGATVLIGPTDVTQAGGPGGFQVTDPYGAPQADPSILTPWVNIVTGAQWIYSSVMKSWVPGWNNPQTPPAPTAAVASAAGLVTPSGPLFHITGALAITGFGNGTGTGGIVGFTGGSFTVIPDGTFTWTAANNIALAGTAVVSKALTFTYDANSALWYPSYIA